MKNRSRRSRMERELDQEAASEHERLLRRRSFSVRETGSAEPRGRPTMSVDDASDMSSETVGRQVDPRKGAVLYRSPEDCPVCGAKDPLRGDDDRQLLDVARLHPIAANAIDGAADTFLCQVCFAGWVEPDEPEPIAWVRPYWRIESES